MKQGTQFTYIMRNTRNGFFKIGKSIHPVYREKTLQAEEPEVELLALTWEYSEQELHDTFSATRIRGEWFALNDNDLQFILSNWAMLLTYAGELFILQRFGVRSRFHLEQQRHERFAICSLQGPYLV